MSNNNVLRLALGVAALAVVLPAQVLAPVEIKDPALRALQQEHFDSLKKIAGAVTAHRFPYRFSCSRVLDLEEKDQAAADQRSIRFDTYHHQTVLEITGNYYASYSADSMDTARRAQRTLTDVIEPILQAAIPAVSGEPRLDAYAFEVAQHVRKKVLGVTVESMENVEFFLPRSASAGFLAATTDSQRQAALLEGALLVNGSAAGGWEQQAAAWEPEPEPAKSKARGAKKTSASAADAEAPLPAVTPEVARQRQTGYQPALDAIVRDLDKDAHFSAYAPPAFIAFHGGAYLQLSFATTLQQASDGSQYRAAALAFDEQVSHLIRPVLAHLPNRAGLDGVDFSTTVRPAGAPPDSSSLSVEFVFPQIALTCYEKYDCTGQQLIDQGFVLVNGERVGLELQAAEAGGPGQ